MTAQKSNIYFTGFMGSGKSTISPLVANILGYAYLDIDSEIERVNNATIADIFQNQGELRFREIEQSILLEASQQEHYVIALGGGTVTFEKNLHIVQSTGLLIYLKADIETIIERVHRKQHRPLLFGEDGATLSEHALRNRITALLEKREKYYSKADMIIEVGNTPVGTTVDRIVDTLRKKGIF